VTTSGQTDEQIIQGILQGDRSAFAVLVDRHKNYVFSLVLRFTTSREDAEEISQDVFVKAFRSLADFRGDSKFSTWLFTITRTTCLSFLRKKKIDIRSLDDERLGIEVENKESGFGANLVEQKSRHGMLHQAIRMLSPDDAQVLNLFYKADQSLEEIGRIMRLDPNTVKVKLHRARRRLREKIEKYFANELREIHAD
jgi:RNA polymerase sigma factor (sigma-70 family)